MFKYITAAFTAAFALAAAPSAAATYQYDSPNNVGGSGLHGVYNSTYIYQDTTERFALNFEVKDDAGVDGFWFVVNNGPMPFRDRTQNYAIFYSDLTDIWAYQYQGGGNNNGSFRTPLLQKFENAVTATSVGTNIAYSMLLNVAGINAANLTPGWEGIRLGENIGTWLHPTINTFAGCATPYETDGDLNCFNSNNWIGWDEANAKTRIVLDNVLPPVPLPAGLPLLLAGLGAFGLVARRKRH